MSHQYLRCLLPLFLSAALDSGALADDRGLTATPLHVFADPFSRRVCQLDNGMIAAVSYQPKTATRTLHFLNASGAVQREIQFFDQASTGSPLCLGGNRVLLSEANSHVVRVFSAAGDLVHSFNLPLRPTDGPYVLGSGRLLFLDSRPSPWNGRMVVTDDAGRIFRDVQFKYGLSLYGHVVRDGRFVLREYVADETINIHLLDEYGDETGLIKDVSHTCAQMDDAIGSDFIIRCDLKDVYTVNAAGERHATFRLPRDRALAAKVSLAPNGELIIGTTRYISDSDDASGDVCRFKVDGSLIACRKVGGIVAGLMKIFPNGNMVVEAWTKIEGTTYSDLVTMTSSLEELSRYRVGIIRPGIGENSSALEGADGFGSSLPGSDKYFVMSKRINSSAFLVVVDNTGRFRGRSKPLPNQVLGIGSYVWDVLSPDDFEPVWISDHSFLALSSDDGQPRPTPKPAVLIRFDIDD